MEVLPRPEAGARVRDVGDGGETELLGWATAGIERANVGAVGDMTVRVVAALRNLSDDPGPAYTESGI